MGESRKKSLPTRQYFILNEGETLTGWVNGNGRRVSFVVIGLDIRVCKRLVQTLDDGLEFQFWRGTGESIRQDVSGGNFDRLLEKIVFEDDETGVQRTGVAEDELPVLQNLGGRDGPCADVEIWETSVRQQTIELDPKSDLRCQKSSWDRCGST